MKYLQCFVYITIVQNTIIKKQGTNNQKKRILINQKSKFEIKVICKSKVYANKMRSMS